MSFCLHILGISLHVDCQCDSLQISADIKSPEFQSDRSYKIIIYMYYIVILFSSDNSI